MRETKGLLLALLALLAGGFAAWWVLELRRSHAADRVGAGGVLAKSLAIGALTNFFDTLGVGSFAPTTALFRGLRLVPDRLLPGTLNVGHALPSVVQALVFIAMVEVEPRTLGFMIGAAVAGAWLGAGAVAAWSQRRVQLGLGLALLVAAALLARQLALGTPVGAQARSLAGARLAVGVAGNFALGALMTLGVGLYAPCMILVTLLGMNAKAAFPIMMGSCAFLMPVAGVRFVAERAYALRAALGLALGGMPAVLVAAFVVRSLPLDAVRALVLGVALYTAVSLLLAARKITSGTPRTPPTRAPRC
ncbi:MAG TPA: permease [Candidatus Binatia bacterium]|nr:permease [Candidatus Binatia bacterium]